jgi:hypothetical protein
MREGVERRVKFLPDSALWCWEVIDANTGVLIGSS